MNQADLSIFKGLYGQYKGMVLSLCRGFMKGDPDMANDLAQDVFINVWNALPRHRGDSSFKTWIYRITVNTCLLQIRKDKNKVRLPLDTVAHAADNDANTALTENEQILYSAIGRLSEVERIVIMMMLEEVEYDEIASVIGITENNLRVKIHRIKAKLKAIMENERRIG